VRDGWVDPKRVDHFLCHYSSEKFIPVVEDLMAKADLAIPRERWWSNLAWRGNTGAASILIMLSEFLHTKTLKPGEQIFCYVPESGRFMAAYMLLEVEPSDAPAPASSAPSMISQPALSEDEAAIAPPHDPAAAPEGLGALLTELAGIWHDYRSRVWRTPLIRQIRERRFALPDYLNWMEQWVPQVREGSRWMREGAASLTGPYKTLAALIDVHAGEEQDDFNILFSDYKKAGGAVARIDDLRRNPGGEALNAYLHGLAATRDPIGLLGAIYIIEGTGQRIVPALLPLIKAGLKLPPDAFRFLEYHGHNDENHLNRWLAAVEMVMAVEAEKGGNDASGRGRAVRQIIDTARHTAALYLMQFQHITERMPHEPNA
jgi:3-oxoacyl-[acyl-carrier-protein] synthase-3